MAYSEQMWQDAKKKCRLNNEDISFPPCKRRGLAIMAQPPMQSKLFDF